MNMRARGCLIGIGVSVGIVALVGIVLILGLPKYQQYARRAWKEGALPEIRRLADDPSLVSAEINMLGGPRAGNGRVLAEHWLSDRLILMSNGEWLVYKSHCSKVSPRLVSDIFLAKGSNGKWHYSTYHFCVGMCVLVMMQDAQPRDLAAFAKTYHLQEFDGQSDECLKEKQTFPRTYPTR